MTIHPPAVEFFKRLVALFIVATSLNFPWEISQAFLFEGMDSTQALVWHCFVAALGDGVMVWLIYLVGWAAFGRTDWFVRPCRKQYGVMLGTGLVLAIAVEWVAVDQLQRWAYTGQMPMIPGLGIGLTPVLQMLFLPPLIFYAVGRWRGPKTLLTGP